MIDVEPEFKQKTDTTQAKIEVPSGRIWRLLAVTMRNDEADQQTCSIYIWRPPATRYVDLISPTALAATTLASVILADNFLVYGKTTIAGLSASGKSITINVYYQDVTRILRALP